LKGANGKQIEAPGLVSKQKENSRQQWLLWKLEMKWRWEEVAGQRFGGCSCTAYNSSFVSNNVLELGYELELCWPLVAHRMLLQLVMQCYIYFSLKDGGQTLGPVFRSVCLDHARWFFLSEPPSWSFKIIVH
jgi:hypothetical protein